jgi:hypothetical protein
MAAQEKIFEIKFGKTSKLNSKARREVEQKLVASKLQDYQGYAKTIIKTSSPPRIVSVEPIKGTIIDYLKDIERRGGKHLVF